MTRWTRVNSNRDLGAYEHRVASGDVSEPIWPKLTLQEILKVAFREQMVNSLDHPLIKRLNGEAL
jgi:hypothetical protein